LGVQVVRFAAQTPRYRAELAACKALLTDPEWSRWSDREIARQCRVDNAFVGKLRKAITVDVNSDPIRRTPDRWGGTREMDVSDIGRREPPSMPDLWQADQGA
jgi:hypothetical protein